MGLKSDKWIRKMALENNMINPFAEKQIQRGVITLEISNTTSLPAKIYANEGIAQLIFLEADEECEMSYADKRGRYQDQIGVVGPRMKD